MTYLIDCPLVELTFGNSKVKVRKQHQSQPGMLHKMALVVGKQMDWCYVGRDCGGRKERGVAVPCSPPWRVMLLLHKARSSLLPGPDAGEQPSPGWVDGKPVQNSVTVWWPAYLEAGKGKCPKYHTHPPSHPPFHTALQSIPLQKSCASPWPWLLLQALLHQRDEDFTLKEAWPCLLTAV